MRPRVVFYSVGRARLLTLDHDSSKPSGEQFREVYGIHRASTQAYLQTYTFTMYRGCERRNRAPRIVFTGGGQAHLYSLLLRRELVREGFDVTLVNSSLYLYYSAVARRLRFTRLARTAPPGAQTSH